MTANYRRRRTELRSRLQTGITYALGDHERDFDADLYYLTGLRGRARLLLGRDQELLLVRQRDEREIIFDGDLTLVQSTRDLPIKICSVREESALSIGALAKDAAPELRRELAWMRWVKDDTEIEQMRRASRITRDVHEKTRSLLRDGISEWELKVEFERGLFLAGCREIAYGTIVAAGENANTLHYREALGHAQQGRLVLLDGGGKIAAYASDVTSTWAVGEAREEEARVLEWVRAANARTLQAVRPGVTLKELQRVAEESLFESLEKAGVVFSRAEVRDLFPHRVSHWIGLDVHDPKLGDDADQPLVAGVTITVEPGLYFHARTSRDYGRYRGVAARLEDVVLVTESGAEVLSRSASARHENSADRSSQSVAG